MQVMIAVVETEFTEGFLHIVFPLLCFSKGWMTSGGEHKAEEHHWTHTCTFPVCAISKSGAVQTAEGTLSFSLCPFRSYYTGKGAPSRDWRAARAQKGRKVAAECLAVAQQPGLEELMVLAGMHSQGVNACETGCEGEGLAPELQYSILTCHMAQHFSLGTAAYVQH